MGGAVVLLQRLVEGASWTVREEIFSREQVGSEQKERSAACDMARLMLIGQ